MGISIDTVTHGISKQGAEQFRQKIHQEAILDTKDQLDKTDGITTALEAGWQGQAEVNFVKNLQNVIVKTKAALDELDTALTTEFENIENAVIAADEEMVAVEE